MNCAFPSIKRFPLGRKIHRMLLQHMSHSVIRLACYLAVVCGVSLRHIALLFSVLFLIAITKSSVKRWIDDIGTHLPTPEEMLRQLLARVPVTECGGVSNVDIDENNALAIKAIGITI